MAYPGIDVTSIWAVEPSAAGVSECVRKEKSDGSFSTDIESPNSPWAENRSSLKENLCVGHRADTAHENAGLSSCVRVAKRRAACPFHE